MQIIRTGHTRLVILISDYAIKIARPGIGYCLGRIFAILHNRETNERITMWRRERGGVMRVVLEALLSGLLANIQEYRLSRSSTECELAETIFSCGIINIQRRGEVVEEKDIRTHPLVKAVRAKATNSDFIADTIRAEQFCRINGHIRLADYGNPQLPRFLALMNA